MKTKLFAALLLAASFAGGTASAQTFPFNEAGVTNGHWHLNSKDVAANRRSSSAWAARHSRPAAATA